MRRLVVRGLLALLVLGLAVTIGAAAWAWSLLHRPGAVPPGNGRVVIASGTGTQAVFEQLERAGVIPNAWLARAWWHVEGSPPLQAGTYEFDRPLATPEVLARLVAGDVVQVGVTIVEGLTLEETAAALAAAGLGEVDRFVALMHDPTPIADLDPAAETLEGYLFPESYRFHEGTSPERIVRTLVETFRSRWDAEVAPRLPPPEPGAPSDPPVRRLVTLASIVEKEARLDEERPLIAGVYANRLERGIALYADPTVIYALRRLGRWDGNLRRGDLQVDSPYNTYRYPGLPPGPICSPGLASLVAAAAPAEVPWIYFVSRNDGSHVFAATLAEHNRNVARWQRQYWRERWARERAARNPAPGETGGDPENGDADSP